MAQKFRITYATLSADNEDLQRAYDEAAERVRSELGKDYPVIVNGEERWTRGAVRGALAHRQGHRHRPLLSGRALGRQRCRRGREGVPAGMGSDRVAGARAHPAGRRRRHGGPSVRPRRDDGLRGGQEPARGARRRPGDGRADPLELRRDGEARRLPRADERIGRRGRLLRRSAAPRHMGRHQPLQLPDGALGRPVLGRARGGQLRRAEALEPGRAPGLQALRVLSRRRGAARRVPPGRRAAAWWRARRCGSTPTSTASRSPAPTRWAWTSTSTSRPDVPKPVICEMGGKNPTIVTKNADLDKATDGVLRSAFGFGGQKCSACSRVFVEREVYDDFLQGLKTKTEKIKVGNPIERDVYLGPVINEAALDDVRGGRRGGTQARHHRDGRPAHHRGRLRPRSVRGTDGRRGAR